MVVKMMILSTCVLLTTVVCADGRIEIPAASPGFWHNGRYAVEPGEFAAWIAPDSDRGKELHFKL